MKVKPTTFDEDGNVVSLGSKFYAEFTDYEIFPVNEFSPLPGVKELTAASDLVKAGRNVIGVALAHLESIPRVDEFSISVPWVTMPRPVIDVERWEDSTLETVRIESLRATQEKLNVHRVRHYINRPGAIEENRRAFANVYDEDGKLAIVDGHHRLAALWMLGADEALAWMLRKDS